MTKGERRGPAQPQHRLMTMRAPCDGHCEGVNAFAFWAQWEDFTYFLVIDTWKSEKYGYCYFCVFNWHNVTAHKRLLEICVNGMSATFSSTAPVWKGTMPTMLYTLLFSMCMRRKTNEGLVAQWCFGLACYHLSRPLQLRGGAGFHSHTLQCWEPGVELEESRVSWRLVSSYPFILNQSVSPCTQRLIRETWHLEFPVWLIWGSLIFLLPFSGSAFLHFCLTSDRLLSFSR